VEDKQDTVSQQETTQALLEPIGVRVIGEVDPRTLTEEQFRNSPNLLFHGAKEDFVFSRDFDYENFQNPGGFTIGAGFYTTDNEEEARHFSRARQDNSSETRVVLPILPYQARIFDLRARNNQSVNAPVPNEIFQGYLNFIESKFGPKYEGYNPQEDKDFINRHSPTDETSRNERIKRSNRLLNFMSSKNYLESLRRLKRRGTPINLRSMLSEMGDKHRGYASFLFPEFMQKEGYDGIIYIEGGDIPEQKNPTTYVFYDLEKVGTFESWRETKQ